jgi:hypothetical protein
LLLLLRLLLMVMTGGESNSTKQAVSQHQWNAELD